MTDRIVGIDLGTSNTVVAYVDELERVKLAPDPEGHTVHPSVVSFHPNGGVVVGVAGKQRKVLDPKNTIYSAKRMIGQPWSSPAVQETARRVPFPIIEGPNKQALVSTRTGEFAIPEISAIVLDHARKLASTAMGSEVSRAVVTVPASFTDVQRSSTATAGALAGLTVVRVLNEPTAAAIAYGATKRLDEIIAVYDWGGGTFDITILQLQDQVYTVLGTSGDAFLGGEDMDERLVDRMVASFLEKHRIDLRADEVAMMRLRAVAEHTKIELSRRSRALVKVEEIAFGPKGAAIDLEVTLTREELLASIGDLIDRTFSSCKEALVLAGIGIDRVADVVLVGGTTRIPLVREQVARFFRRQPRADMNPEDAIATGAALQAASIEAMLSRVPARPMPSVPIPLDDLEEQASATEVSVVTGTPVAIDDVEREPSKIAEVKRPKRGTDMFSGRPKREADDPATTAARAQAFFGDLFGDKAAKPGDEPAKPAGKQLTRTQPIGRIAPTPKPAKPAQPALPPIVETRREPPAPKHRTMALPHVIIPPAPKPPAPPPPPASMPSIELDDEFNERSGELWIDVDQAEARKRGDSGSQFAIEVDAPSQAPRRDDGSQIAIEIDPPSLVPGRGVPVESQIAIEIDPPSQVPGRAIDLDPPSLFSRAGAATPTAYDLDPPPGRPDAFDPTGLPRVQPAGERASASGGISIDLDDFGDHAGAAPLEPEPAAIQLLDPDAPSPPGMFDLVMPPPRRPEQPAIARRTEIGVPLAEPPAPQPWSGTPSRMAPTVVDVTPRSLGIGTVAGFCEELIRRNSQLPIAARKLFSTARDLQDTVRIVVCQGESRRLENNVLIGDLILENLPRRRRGETQIDVEFRMDVSGILHVTARDVATGTEQRARLDLLGGMAPEHLSAAANRLKQLANIPTDE